MSTPPWTPAPWTIERSDHGYGGTEVDTIDPAIEPVVVDHGGDWFLGVSDPDAELIALAPEMAEMILTISDADLSVYDDVPEAHDLMNQLDAIADKLRAISSSN